MPDELADEQTGLVFGVYPGPKFSQVKILVPSVWDFGVSGSALSGKSVVWEMAWITLRKFPDTRGD